MTYNIPKKPGKIERALWLIGYGLCLGLLLDFALHPPVFTKDTLPSIQRRYEKASKRWNSPEKAPKSEMNRISHKQSLTLL